MKKEIACNGSYALFTWFSVVIDTSVNCEGLLWYTLKEVWLKGKYCFGDISNFFTFGRHSWALVKDEQVAKRMVKFIELSTIGVSKDSQLRAAQVLKVVSDSCESREGGDSFFEYSYHLMDKRWEKLQAAVQQSKMFSMPLFPPQFCKFHKRIFKPQPGKKSYELCLWINLHSYIFLKT